MNKYNFLSLMLASILVFTLFTPFSYSTIRINFNTEGGTSCSDRVWFDQINYSELNEIRRITNLTIQAWGDKALGAYENNLEKAGLASNPDALGTNKLFIPGVDGVPRPVYDIINKKAVSPNQVCHLNDFMTSSKMSYAGLLTDNLRYCVTGDSNCEDKKTLKEAQRSQFIDHLGEEVIGALSLGWDDFFLGVKATKQVAEGENPFDEYGSVTENLLEEYDKDDSLRNVFQTLGYNKEKLEELINKAKEDASARDELTSLMYTMRSSYASQGIHGSSYMESNDTTLTIAFDNWLFFPKTKLDFINFMKDPYIKGLTTLTMASDLIGAGMGFYQIGRSALSFKNILLGEGGGRVSSFIRTLRYGRTAEQRGTSISRLVQRIRNPALSARSRASAARELAAVLRDNNNFVGIDKLDDADDIIEVLSRVGGRKEDDIIKSLENLEKTGVLDDVNNYASRLVNPPQPSPTIPQGSVEIDGETVRSLSNGAENLQSITAEEAARYAGAEIGEVTPTTQQGRFARFISGITTGSTRFIDYLTKLYKSNWLFRTITLNSFLAFRRANIITANLLWIRDTFFQSALLSAEGVNVINLNENTRLSAKEKQLPFFVEIQTTNYNQGLKSYLNNLLDMSLSVFGIDPKEKGFQEVRRKISNMGNILIIYDESAYYTQTGREPVNFVTSNAYTGNNWILSSYFNGKAQVYNMEHPNKYKNGGLSMLGIHISNVNIYTIVRDLETLNSEAYDTLSFFVGTGRLIRNVASATALVSLIPVVTVEVGGALGGLAGGAVKIIGHTIGGILGGAYFIFGGAMQPIYDAASFNYFETQNIEDIYNKVPEDKLCKNVFGPEEKSDLTFWKELTLITSASSTVLSTPGLQLSPHLLVAQIAVTIIDQVVRWVETEKEETIARKLGNCIETEYSTLAYQRVLKEEELNEETENVLKEIEGSLVTLGDLFGQGDTFEQYLGTISQLQQLPHINGELDGENVVVSFTKELYNIHFMGGDLKWFHSTDCKLDMCDMTLTGEYQCFSQNGYQLLDNNGNVVFEGPQANSFHVNLDEGYAGIVQKSIEIKKEEDAGHMLVIPDPNKISIEDECLKTAVSDLAKIPVDELTSSRFGELLGGFQSAYTPEAAIWFKGNDVGVIAYEEKTCNDGTQLGIGETHWFSDARIAWKNNPSGTIDVLDKNSNKVLCSFDMKDSGAISFENGMIKSGRIQAGKDYSGEFHLFIYSLLTFVPQDVEGYNFNDVCEVDDQGNVRGVKLNLVLSGAYSQQALDLMNDICLNNFNKMAYDDEGNPYPEQFAQITEDGQFCWIDDKGTKHCQRITGVSDNKINLDDGSAWELYKGEDGLPYMQYYQNGQPVGAPIPIMWATGLGGAMMYNPSTGTISIKNEFPFAMNPQFITQGAGGLGFMTPQLPPWGGTPRTTTPAAQGTGQQNIIAQLPGVPENKYWYAIFVVAIMAGVMIVRRKYKQGKHGKGKE